MVVLGGRRGMFRVRAHESVKNLQSVTKNRRVTIMREIAFQTAGGERGGWTLCLHGMNNFQDWWDSE